LYEEAKIFCDWYVPTKLSKKKCIKFNYEFKKEVKILLSKLNFKNDTFVHRDFHISNLMYYKKKIGVIDTQDALIGNKAYDLASLIDDVRYKSSNSLKEKIYKYYIKTNKEIDTGKFKNDFDILSVLRNLKIIGIFVRLAERDKKRKYLKLIPYAWKLIDDRIKNNQDLQGLKSLLISNFPNFLTK
jgi:aminoglycoside/choline kinase family phosphotransferase